MSSDTHTHDEPGHGGDGPGEPGRSVRPHRRRLVATSVAAAVLLAGGGTYLGQSLLGDGESSQNSAAPADEDPAPLRLDGQGSTSETRSGSSASYQLAGEAPDGPDSAPVYRTGQVDKAAVAKLAKTLGLDGKPRQQSRAWVVSEGTDRTGPALRVSGTEEGQRGQWSFSAHSPGVDPKCGKMPQPDKPPKCPAFGDRSTGNGSAGAASSHQTTGAATRQGAQSPVSEERAKEAAAPVLRSVGLEEAELDAKATTGALRTVKAQPQLDGLSIRGWDTTVTVGSDGEIVRGHGALAPLRKGSDYPLLGAEETLAQLNKNPPPHPDIQCVKEPCESGDDSGPIEVRDPVLELAAHSSDGKRVFVPSWRFELGDKNASGNTKTVSYPALEPRHMAPAEDPSNGADGGTGSEPGTPDPSDKDGSAKPVPPGNGVEPYSPEDRTLTVHFWGGVCSDYTVVAKETASTVKITIKEEEKEPGGVCIKIAKSMSEEVSLDKPVGDRDIVDQDGKELKKR